MNSEEQVVSKGWLRFPASAVSSDELDKLLEQIDQQVTGRIASKDYSEDDLYYVKKVDLRLSKGSLDISDKELERLRLLCSLWDVDLRPAQITSHRPVIGPLIVAAKRIMFPILKVFLKDLIRQQKDFNAATIMLLSDLANNSKALEKD